MRKTPTSGRALRLLVGVSALSVLLSGSMTARPPSDPPVYALWTPMATYKPSSTPTLAPEPEIILEPAWVAPEPPQRVVRQQPKVEVETRAPRRRALPVSGASITGVATWYCWPAYPSRCTVGYPASGAYAAAGPELRRALGKWRGKYVFVNGIRVRLIDWCACGGDHVIDVYHSTWVTIPNQNRVTITW